MQRWGVGSGLGLGFCLGAAQLLAWGALYYGIAVIGDAMSSGLGLSRQTVFAVFTWALIVAALAAPAAGRLIDRYGGRVVLTIGALLGAVGFFVLSESRTWLGLLLAWSINGVAMALGLYEACFAAIGQVRPREYLRLVTTVTLVAGFASSVAWPVSHHVLETSGWRGVCLVYCVGLLASAAVYALCLPGARRFSPDAAGEAAPSPLDPLDWRRVQLLAWVFAGVALVTGAASAHLLTILETSGLQQGRAVWVGAAVGVTQVGGRLLQFVMGGRDIVRLGVSTLAGLFLGTLLLLACAGDVRIAILFAVVYGMANGLVTIVKAVLPMHLLGERAIGRNLGTFSRPALVVRALAPGLFAWLMAALGTRFALWTLAAVMGVTLAAYVGATRRPRQQQTRAAPSNEGP